ncbi:uncharacterized protein OCT59_001263 [Rhizophagus irregularis]|uniref:uncharacterized protein n=1 Tax=Rhizophagus irregularis TaxID=588596 RepID=UPI001C13A812|nr:hypothetical protein OCT59_001263 [Rhizophagus irregularis]CAB4373743.1 unnamed protein product [Rhizophagus irregularis]
MRFARSHCSFEHNYRGNEHLQQFGISINMAVVDAGFFPLQQLIQYYQSSKEHQFQPKDDLPDHTINTFMKEFVNTCQYTEYPNKKPPILRANSYRKNVEEPLK